jgi:hypothetical protein
VKGINSAVLACLDDLFYRLPFPNLNELEKLIKEAKAEASMVDFRRGLKAELETPRALQDFESGWDKYWQETQSPEQRGAAGIQVEESFDERNRSPTPDTGSDREGGGDANAEGRSSSSSVRWRLFLLLPPSLPLFVPPLSPAELPFRTRRPRLNEQR